nr:hypothetical protein [Tanacetum cinerariifolium]
MTAPSGQAPVVGPPVRTDEEIMPRIRAFTASSTILSIHIREALYYQEYQANVAKHRWFLAGEPARKPNLTAQKVRINILQCLFCIFLGSNLESYTTVEDKKDLSQPGKLCWWTTQRGILQTSKAY